MSFSTLVRPRSAGARVLRAVTALTTPLLPQDYLAVVNPVWSSREARGRIVRVQRETADATTLVIRPGATWAPHRAGQWVTVAVQIDGVWQSRSYSVTSPAGGDGTFSITVKADPAGRVSPHLVHRTKPGTVLRLAPARGEFVLPDLIPGRLMFLTGGSGITPVLGMLRTLAAGPSTPDVLHVHSARHTDDVIGGAELRMLALRQPGYRLHEQHTNRDGRFTLADLDQLCPDWRDRPTWACGPAGMLADVEAHWQRAGASELLHVERFQPPAFANPDADGGAITFTATGRRADAPGGTSLLDAGERAGVAMPSGCRMGICFSCVAPLRSGQVRDLRTGEIHGDEGQLIQTCVSGAAGPCEIDL